MWSMDQDMVQIKLTNPCTRAIARLPRCFRSRRFQHIKDWYIQISRQKTDSKIRRRAGPFVKEVDLLLL